MYHKTVVENVGTGGAGSPAEIIDRAIEEALRQLMIEKAAEHGGPFETEAVTTTVFGTTIAVTVLARRG